MKYINSLTFRFLILFILAMIIPTSLLGIFSTSYFKDKFMEEIDRANDQTASLLIYNLDNYISEMERLTLSPYTNIEFLQAIREINKNIKAGTPEDNYVIFNELDYIIPKTFMYVDDTIKGFAVGITDSLVLSCEKYNTVQAYEMRDAAYTKWYNDIVQKPQSIYYMGVNQVAYYRMEDQEVFSVIRIIKDYNTNKIQAVMKVDGDASYIEKMMQDIGFSKDTIIAITDQNNEVVYKTSLDESIGHQIQLETIRTDDYVVSTNVCKRTGWNIHIFAPIKEMEDKVKEIYSFTVYITIGCVVLALLVYGLMIGRILNPFKKIVRGLAKVELDTMDKPIEVKTDVIEIQVLQSAINRMLLKINEHIDKEYKAVLGKKNAEYEALQARINPHFLYNTLAGFITLNRLGQKEILQTGIYSLTGMMRYIFEKKMMSTIEMELLFVKQYLELSKMRFDERLTYHIHMDEEVKTCVVPKLILQPIVENSIVHGLEPSSQECSIQINSYQIKDPFKDGRSYVGIVVKDTGVGFDMRSDYLKPGEGLYNIKERLEATFKECIFFMESIEGVGTTTTIIIECKGEHDEVYYRR